MKRSFKSLVVGACKQLLGNNQRIRALESERLNLLLEIDELKRMADTKAKVLESEISMHRVEVKSLLVILSGEDFGADLGQKEKR